MTPSTYWLVPLQVSHYGNTSAIGNQSRKGPCFLWSLSPGNDGRSGVTWNSVIIKTSRLFTRSVRNKTCLLAKTAGFVIAVRLGFLGGKWDSYGCVLIWTAARQLMVATQSRQLRWVKTECYSMVGLVKWALSGHDAELMLWFSTAQKLL